MEPLVTIGITSYKRVNELVRCINSVKTQYFDEIEILVSEDKSPLSKEIEDVVNDISKNSQYHIEFSSNPENLGYDMNLGAIIFKARGKYVFFMSDDDMLAENCLDEIIPILRKDATSGVIYSPFIYPESGKLDRKRSSRNFRILSGEKNAAYYVYDSILFSGLIFRKAFIEKIDSSRFKNLNYFQVYLFLQMLYEYGGYYIATPSVLCVGDGENAYGLSESSKSDSTENANERNAILADRKSVKSNLEFNKSLIKVIRMFDEDNDTNVIAPFSRQYSLHAISGMTIARREGKKYFKEYWNILNGLDIHLYPITKIYYALLLVLGADITTALLSGFRKMKKKER